MASLRFNVKPVDNKKMQIRAIFQDGKQQLTKNIGETIPSTKVNGKYKHWDETNQITRNIDRANRINSKIQKIKSAFISYKDDCDRQEKTINIREFLNTIDGKNTPVVAGTNAPMLAIFAAFLKSIAATHDPRTKSSYKVLENDIKDMEEHNGETYTVADIDHAWYKKLVSYLISEEKNYNATINKKQGKIITLVRYAQKELKLKPNPDYREKYTLKTVQAPKFPLQPVELATLWADNTDANFQKLKDTLATLQNSLSNLQDPRITRMRKKNNEAITNAESALYHQMCLDAFLLATETGMRYSDISQLKPVHIISHITPAGSIIKIVDLTEMKTDDITTMALSDKAIGIIDRYTTDDKHAPLFNFTYSQVLGKVLKTVFKDKELTRPCELIKKQGAKTTREIKPLHDVISFHMGRNTFITRLLTAGLPLVHVQDNVGHSKPEVTMGYFRNEDLTRFQATLAILNAN